MILSLLVRAAPELLYAGERKWPMDLQEYRPRYLDRNRVEEWKTIFHELEGWDIKAGWPLKGTLADLGLQGVAEDLQKAGKLPAGDIPSIEPKQIPLSCKSFFG